MAEEKRRKKKHLFAEYKCEKCGGTFQMDHGPLKELPECWNETTCPDMEKQGCEREMKVIKDHLGKDVLIPVKSTKLVKTWFAKM